MQSWLHPSSLLLPAGRLSGRRFRLRSDVSARPQQNPVVGPSAQSSAAASTAAPNTLISEPVPLFPPEASQRPQEPLWFFFFNISAQNNMRNKRKKHGPITKLSQPEKQACVLPIPLSSGGSPKKKRGASMGLGATTHLLVGRPHFPRTWVSSQTSRVPGGGWGGVGIKCPCTSLEPGHVLPNSNHRTLRCLEPRMLEWKEPQDSSSPTFHL